VSREQQQALDKAPRKAPQPFGPVPVEKMREGFAAFMGSFPVPARVRSASAELAGRSILFRDPDDTLVNLYTPVTDEAITRFRGRRQSRSTPSHALVWPCRSAQTGSCSPAGPAHAGGRRNHAVTDS